MRRLYPRQQRIHTHRATFPFTRFLHPQRYALPQRGRCRNVCAGKREEIKREGHGMHYETREVHRCILNGKTESEIVPWNDSLRWAQTFSRLAYYDQK